MAEKKEKKRKRLGAKAIGKLVGDPKSLMIKGIDDYGDKVEDEILNFVDAFASKTLVEGETDVYLILKGVKYQDDEKKCVEVVAVTADQSGDMKRVLLREKLIPLVRQLVSKVDPEEMKKMQEELKDGQPES